MDPIEIYTRANNGNYGVWRANNQCLSGLVGYSPPTSTSLLLSPVLQVQVHVSVQCTTLSLNGLVLQCGLPCAPKFSLEATCWRPRNFFVSAGGAIYLHRSCMPRGVTKFSHL